MMSRWLPVGPHSSDGCHRIPPNRWQQSANPCPMPSASASPQCFMVTRREGTFGATFTRVATPCKAGHVQARHEPVESISAVTLLVVEMAATVTFYQALGFHLLYGGIEAAFTSFRVGAGYLNLQLDTDGSPERAIWGRVVFWVDNVDAMHERCVAAGFRPDTSPADAPWGERYFHIRDPSGHELSFARPLAR
jgi:catechol 2,3-dioxygenase-like lactoylglutathione lyase family enzyme